jgi:hypothetical protein
MKRRDEMVRIGLVWLRIGTSGELKKAVFWDVPRWVWFV